VALACVIAAGCSGNSTATVGPMQAQVGAGQQASRRLIDGLTVSRSGAVSMVPAGLKVSSRPASWMRFGSGPDAGKGDTYVGQFSGTPVQEYRENNKRNRPPLCSLPGQSVNGIAVDPAGNLWVPSGTGGGQGYTQEYAPNCGAAGLKVTDPNGQPADVGFDSKGNIYIMNIFDAAGAAGTVNIYNASGTLTGSLSDPSFSELIGIATDSKDDIFVSNRQSNGNANVVEFPGGQMPGTVLTGIVLGLPGAPQFDRADDLIITDWNALTLNIYAPPYTGSPAVKPMHGLSLWCPLSHNEKRLSCADLGNGSVDVYSYPSATYLYSYTNGLTPSGFATGAATDPGAPF